MEEGTGVELASEDYRLLMAVCQMVIRNAATGPVEATVSAAELSVTTTALCSLLSPRFFKAKLCDRRLCCEVAVLMGGLAKQASCILRTFFSLFCNAHARRHLLTSQPPLQTHARANTVSPMRIVDRLDRWPQFCGGSKMKASMTMGLLPLV